MQDVVFIHLLETAKRDTDSMCDCPIILDLGSHLFCPVAIFLTSYLFPCVSRKFLFWLPVPSALLPNS